MPGVVPPISIAKIASGSSVNESTLSVPGLAPGEKIPPGWTHDVTGDVAVAAENGAVLNSDVAEPGAGTGEVFDEEFASGDNPWQTDQSTAESFAVAWSARWLRYGVPQIQSLE